MKLEHSTESIRLTSLEIGNIWSSYIFESMVHHAFTCFLCNVQDSDIKSYIEYCQVASREHLDSYITTLKKESFPVPRGTTSEDINVDAPRLFSDIFYIRYIKHMASFAITTFALSYSQCTRKDIRQLFQEHLNRLEVVDQMGTDIMLSKGIYLRSPYIPAPKQVDFVKRERFFSGFLDDKRPLSVLEISQLFSGAESNALGKALMVGFCQVTQSEKFRQYFLKGKETAAKYYSMFSNILLNEDISVPPSFDGEVLASTESPFSDRFMLNHTTLLSPYGLSTYGMSLSKSQRNDLSAMYARIMAETGSYAREGANLLIQHEWMEQPPLAPDRNNLFYTKISHESQDN